MEKIFNQVLSMSLTGSFVILGVLTARLALKKAPRIFSYLLFCLVWIRLLCPVTFTSELSMRGWLEGLYQEHSAENIWQKMAGDVFSDGSKLRAAMIDEEITDGINSTADGSFMYTSDKDVSNIRRTGAGISGKGMADTGKSGAGISGKGRTDTGIPGAGISDTGIQGRNQTDDGGRVFILSGYGKWVWLMGFCVMAFTGLASVWKLKRQLMFAVREREAVVQHFAAKGGHSRPSSAVPQSPEAGNGIKNIYLSDQIGTPFVMGTIRPRIYLPVWLSGKERDYILLHEQIHIKRLDHIMKLISFAALCIHWFNPLVWAAFYMSCRDMEISCDEAVIRKLGSGAKKDYAALLLAMTAGRKRTRGLTLAFGEEAVKKRIRNVLEYRKPGIWAIGAAAVLVAALCLVLLSDPAQKSPITDNLEIGAIYRPEDILYLSPTSSATTGYMLMKAPDYTISEDYGLYSLGLEDKEWQSNGSLLKTQMSDKELDELLKFSLDEKKDKIRNLLSASDFCYRADKEKAFFLIFRQQDDSLLLAEGSGENEQAYIRNIFKLKEVSSELWCGEIYKYRSLYTGDHVMAGNILQRLPWPASMAADGFELETGKEPYGIKLSLTEKSLRGEEIERRDEQKLAQNAGILFSLIENLGIVQFQISDEAGNSKTAAFTKGELEAITGTDLWKSSESLKGFQKLCRNMPELIHASEFNF